MEIKKHIQEAERPENNNSADEEGKEGKIVYQFE